MQKFKRETDLRPLCDIRHMAGVFFSFVTALTAASIPVGATVATVLAITVVGSVVYEVSKELFRQDKKGESMDVTDAFTVPFQGGTTDVLTMAAGKKMKPLIDLLENLPYREAQMLLKEIGESITELGISLGGDAIMKQKIPSTENVREKGGKIILDKALNSPR